MARAFSVGHACGSVPLAIGKDAPMTADVFDHPATLPLGNAKLVIPTGFYQILRRCSYIPIAVLYISVLVAAVQTLGLIEIRQANLTAFNSLIATLDQRDWYRNGYFDTLLSSIAADRTNYQRWATSFSCSDQPGRPPAKAHPISQVPEKRNDAREDGHVAPPKTCAEIRATINDHLKALSLLEEDVLFKKANLNEFYDSYRDGIRNQAPQLIPVLGLLDSGYWIVNLWARTPLELLEMLLLICMGALGAVISVTRCFVDPTLPNPLIRDLCYRPVAGSVIALGIYILFRAGQLFFGGSGQNDTTLTTSIFILAGLGLASGFCAREAVSQIEAVATRLLRGSGERQAR